jgi:hypothetical protein
LLLGLLTGAIVAPAALLIGRELTLVLFLFVVAICCCCFVGGVAAFAAAAVVGFVVVVCCCGGDYEVDTGDDVGGVAAADPKGGFIVFGIPHILDSVVLTTFRLGLLGSQIFALSCGDIGLLDELLPAAGDDDGGGDDDSNCCANT